VRNPGGGDCWKSLVLEVDKGDGREKEMATVAVLGPSLPLGKTGGEATDGISFLGGTIGGQLLPVKPPKKHAEWGERC